MLHVLQMMTMSMIRNLKFVSKTSTRERLNTSDANISQPPAFPRLPTLHISPSSITNNNPMTQKERKREREKTGMQVATGESGGRHAEAMHIQFEVYSLVRSDTV
jgi:hypothetical protein